jgi:hypothetical protein
MSNSNKHPKNKHGLSRYIPEDVKREVRQRCGFGCVICGLGIYEYEHFDPVFTKAKTHNSDGITLLCPNHHASKTAGKLSVETVKLYNAKPKALSQGFANDKFDFRTNNPVVVLGAATFEDVQVLLQLGSEPIISILPSQEEDEPFFLSATLRDQNGQIIMEIDKNEWKTPSGQWDCKIIGKKIEIRSASRQVELIIRQDPPNMLCIERLYMLHREYKIEAYEGRTVSVVSPKGSYINSNEMRLQGSAIGVLMTDEGAIQIGGGSQSGNQSFYVKNMVLSFGNQNAK